MEVLFKEKDIKVKDLAKEEMYSLILKAQRGSLKARNELVLRNLGLVHFILRKRNYFSSEVFGYNDLVQEGVLGLFEAIMNFDIKKKVQFSTYAFFWIKQRINHYITKYGYPVRVPFHVREKQQRFKTLREKFCFKHDFSHYKTIAKEEGKPFLKIKKWLESKSEKVFFDNLILEKNFFDKVNEEYLKKLLKLDLKLVLFSLPKREQEIIQKHYYEGKTLREIGREMGLSAERIRQIKEEALIKIKEKLKNF